MATGQAGTRLVSDDNGLSINTESSTSQYIVADSGTITWDVGTTNGDSVAVSNFVFADSTNYYVYGTGYGRVMNFVVGYEPASRFRRLKWKLRDISHFIRRWFLRLRQIQQERQWIKAETKAQTLLNELFVLVPGQKFIVVASEIHKDREYRIPIDGSIPQVWVKGVLDHKLCIEKSYKHREHIPRTDIVITRALMAMGAEAEFLRIANRVGASIFADAPDPVFNQPDSDV